jgi:tRNA-binding protein
VTSDNAERSFPDWEIRVGRVLDVDELPAARKAAWKVRVDFGEYGVLQTSAQVTHYKAEDLIGRLVVGVTNIGTRLIAGFTSEFLPLGADSDQGTRLLFPDDGAQPGARIS